MFRKFVTTNRNLPEQSIAMRRTIALDGHAQKNIAVAKTVLCLRMPKQHRRKYTSTTGAIGLFSVRQGPQGGNTLLPERLTMAIRPYS